MLKELIEQGFYLKNDLNCAETILYGANQVYGLAYPVIALDYQLPLGEEWV